MGIYRVAVLFLLLVAVFQGLWPLAGEKADRMGLVAFAVFALGLFASIWVSILG